MGTEALAAFALTSLLLAPGAAPAPEGYHDHEALRKALAELAAREPARARLGSIGRSVGGLDILLLTLGEAEGADSRPALLLLGSPCGEAERLGTEVCLEAARALLAPEHALLLRERTVYVIPEPLPDGRSLVPWDEDGDFETDEDPPEDLDGDGFIGWMRKEDARGDWIVDPECRAAGDERYLRRAERDRGERGRYLVFREGRDRDGDGAIRPPEGEAYRRARELRPYGGFGEDGPGGIHLDRSFPIFARPFHIVREAGPYPLAAPEARALADFLLAHPNIFALRVFHTSGGRGPMGDLAHPLCSGDGGELPPADRKLFEDLEKSYRETPGHKDAVSPFDRPEGSAAFGSLQDFAYFGLGALSFSHRLWDRAPGYEPDPKTKTARADHLLQWLRWSDRELQGKGFLAWRPFRHPDLGLVEIGGFRPATRETPPGFLVPEIARAELPFTLELLGRLPSIELSELEVEPLAEGLFRIGAAVANRGALPTATEMGRMVRRAPRPVVEMILPASARIVFGERRQLVDHLPGGGGRAELSWVIAARAGERVTVRVSSEKAGRAERSVLLLARRGF